MLSIDFGILCVTVQKVEKDRVFCRIVVCRIVEDYREVWRSREESGGVWMCMVAFGRVWRSLY